MLMGSVVENRICVKFAIGWLRFVVFHYFDRKFKFKIVVQNQQPAFSKSIITEGKKWRWKFNNCLFAWYGTVWQGFLEPSKPQGQT